MEGRELYTATEAETEAAGAAFAATLVPGDVVALTGGLGAGKTAFVRGMARHLAPGAHVSSPTYTISHEYPGPVPLFHFDMYRIGGFDDLYNIGFFDTLEAGGICVIEWSENVRDFLPPHTKTVAIVPWNEGRKITLGEGNKA